jgi:cell division protein FtsB
MIGKLKQMYRKLQWQNLRDGRALGLLAFLVIVLLITWSGVKTIQTNYSLQKQIAQLTEENQVQSLQNSDLSLQNEYFNTNQYLEVSARENLGLGAAGETELLVPQSVALSELAPISGQTTTVSTKTNQSTFAKNFSAWMDFLLHRQSSDD